MKLINKIEKYETKIEPEITPEHHKKNVERVVDMLMSVYDRLPANPAPVSESFDELLDQMRHGVKRQPTIIQSSKNDTGIISGDEKTALRASDLPTFINVGGDEISGKNKFTETELQILEKLKNG